MPTAVTARPPRHGPTFRQGIAANVAESNVATGAGSVAGDFATGFAEDFAAIAELFVGADGVCARAIAVGAANSITADSVTAGSVDARFLAAARIATGRILKTSVVDGRTSAA